MLRHLPPTLIIIAVALLYIGTAREGSRGGDDDAAYILHARNLAAGTPYADTGYILNPHYPDLGPQSYPPGYPLLLAPLYRWRGIDLRAMKLQSMLFFAAFLPLYFLLVRRQLSYGAALTALLATGFSPVFWAFKENVSSDFAFLLILFGSLVLIDRSGRGEARRTPWPLYGLVVSIIVWFTGAVRTVGLTVIPALLLVDILRSRRISRFAVVVSATTVALVLLQGVLFRGPENYFERLWPIDPSTVLHNAAKYLKAASGVWSAGRFAPLRLALFGATALAAIWSFVRRLLRRATIVETFVLFYVAAILVFPGSASRYIFPLIPLFFLHVVLALERATSTLSPRTRGSAVAAFACVVLALYGARYASLDYGPIRGPVKREYAEGLFRYIREETAEDDVFVARRPRALCLYAGRRASVYHEASDADLWSYFESIGADYLVSGPEDSDAYLGFLKRSGGRLMVTYGNPQFAVLAIDSGGHRQGTSPSWSGVRDRARAGRDAP